jgi:NTP pyrophosphatase (non-canonical NTP hydrolase)
MDVEMLMVAEFHKARNIAQECKLPQERLVTLYNVGQAVIDLAQSLEERVAQDPRYLRAHLILEEAGELVQAMACGDLESTLDGLADLSYVTVGSAVQFKLPLPEAFEEVHRSNMSKIGGGTNDPRVRDKGASYAPPNFTELLEGYYEDDNN